MKPTTPQEVPDGEGFNIPQEATLTTEPTPEELAEIAELDAMADEADYGDPNVENGGGGA